MGEHAVATIHPAAVDGSEADGANPVEQSLPQREIVDIRRGRSSHLHVHMAGIVLEAAEAGMGLQPAPVGQVDRMRRDVVDRGAAVVVRQRIHVARKLPRGQSRGRRRPRKRRENAQCHFRSAVTAQVGDLVQNRRREFARDVGSPVRASMMAQPCFLAVDRNERMSAKSMAPSIERNPPEIFWRNFIMRPSRSA